MFNNKVTILFIIFSIGLFIAGIQMYGLFISVLLLPFRGFTYNGHPVYNQFINILLFACNLAAIPLLAASLGKTAKEKWLSLALLSGSVIVAIYSRQIYLSYFINKYPIVAKPNTRVTLLISLEYTKYEAYMTAGLIAGYCLLLFYFKRIKDRGIPNLEL